MSILLTLRHRGARGLASRVGSVFQRFGVSPRPFGRRLEQFDAVTAEFGARPSWAITACVLARHGAMSRRFAERGVEYAIHGLVHDDHSRPGFQEQRSSIGRAAEIFKRVGVPYTGFRAPYLRCNRATYDAVRDLGMRYNSTQPVLFPCVPDEPAKECPAGETYRRALEHLYSAIDATRTAVRPRQERGIVSIPVALPDDEIMIERLRFDDRAQAGVWLAILETTFSKGELFTVQLHPERIYECTFALRAALAEARKRRPEVWIATLGEIADWWRRRREATLEVEPVDGGRYRVTLTGPSEAALIVRGWPGVDADPWYGPDRLVRGHSFTAYSVVKPIAGVSPRSPQWVLAFLEEEGVPAEVSDQPYRFGFYVDIEDGPLDEGRLLGELDRARGPLVRLGRWPDGARSALSVTGDIDCITLQDFALRLWETRR